MPPGSVARGRSLRPHPRRCVAISPAHGEGKDDQEEAAEAGRELTPDAFRGVHKRGNAAKTQPGITEPLLQHRSAPPLLPRPDYLLQLCIRLFGRMATGELSALARWLRYVSGLVGCMLGRFSSRADSPWCAGMVHEG